MRSKIEYGSLVFWGSADGHLRNLDAIQRSALKLLQKPELVDPPLPLLESKKDIPALILLASRTFGSPKVAASKIWKRDSVAIFVPGLGGHTCDNKMKL